MGRFSKPEEIKVGVIGYGGAFGMGKAHLNEMKRAGMTPVAVSDVDAERLKVAQQDFPGIRTYNDPATMLRKSDVGLVTIITPHNTHARLAIQCLKAGRHVVCEKPFAVTTKECDAMIAEARKRGLVLSTYHNRHWDGWIMQAMEKIVKEKLIGDVFRVEAHMGGYGQPGDWWRTSKAISGGVLYDWGVHLLEYSLQILDSEMAEVFAVAHRGFWADKTKWKDDTNEDEATAVVRFTNGKWLSLAISSLDANPKRGMLEITGTKGTYIMAPGEFEVITPCGKEKISVKGPIPESEGWRFYQNIADHMVKGTPLVITPEWARRPIHILDLANQSVAKGTAVKVKYR